MREIKFRAWDTENKLWANQNAIAPAWGDSPYLGAMCISGDEILQLESNEYLVWQQFTGLKDRNDKEIYEGDIVNIIDPHVETLSEVVYWTEVGRSYATFGVMGSGTFSDVMAYGNGREIEVIGNIYEAPELLNSDAVQANTKPKSELAQP